jgi:hypothetical protein
LVGIPARSQLVVEGDDEAGNLLECLLRSVPQMPELSAAGEN